jgi:N-acetylmuramoyl-L-alanine amidase
MGAFVAGAERVPTFGGGLRDIELVPWDLAQTRHIEQSSAFAGMLEQQFRGRVPLAATPVERAPLRVLESSNMPAVLIELGYLTNPDQEKLLAGEAFQNAFVQAIYDSVVRFRDSLTGGGTQ